MHLKDLQVMVFEEYKKHDYLARWERARELLKPEGLEGIVDLAEVALIISEISEAIEEIRNMDRDKEAEEHADAIIRILNYCSRKRYDLEKTLIKKHKKNLKRPSLHGRKLL